MSVGVGPSLGILRYRNSIKVLLRLEVCESKDRRTIYKHTLQHISNKRAGRGSLSNEIFNRHSHNEESIVHVQILQLDRKEGLH